MYILKNTELFTTVFLKIDHTLGPFDRFIFFRLWLIHQEYKRETIQLKKLAERLKISVQKLKKTLFVLSKKELIVLQDGDQIVINSTYHFSSKGNCQLLGAYIVLISDIGKFRFHHKQKNRDECFELDYKAWLVLFCLILFSDQHGIVIKVGMHEFNIFTGMDRYSVQRVLNKLFSFGILRSKINGTLDNQYLNFTSAIYFLNLSHPLWENNVRYQKFVFLSLPSQIDLFEQGLSAIDSIKLAHKEKVKESNLPVLFKIPKEDYYYIKNIESFDSLLRDYPHHLLQRVNIVKIKEWKDISLKSTQNKENNRYRLEFMFKYLAQFFNHRTNKIVQLSASSLRKYMFKAKKYIRVDQFELNNQEHHKNILSMWPDTQRALEEGQLQLYAFMSQLLMRNAILSFTNPYPASQPLIISIPVINEKLNGYILASRGLKEDELYEISLIEEDKVYKRIEQKIEMTIENQKKYGLLHTSCEALKF